MLFDFPTFSHLFSHTTLFTRERRSGAEKILIANIDKESNERAEKKCFDRAGVSCSSARARLREREMILWFFFATVHNLVPYQGVGKVINNKNSGIPISHRRIINLFLILYRGRCRQSSGAVYDDIDFHFYTYQQHKLGAIIFRPFIDSITV